MHYPTLTLTTLLLTPTALALTSKPTCYSSTGSLTQNKSSQFQSAGVCHQLCGNALVFAVQGEKCFCGERLPPVSDEVAKGECTVKCPGYPNEVCGGESTFSVYTAVAGGLEHDDSSSSSSSSSSDSPSSDTPTSTSITPRSASTQITSASTPQDDTTLSVNPTIIKTGPTASAATTSIPSSILTAPTGSLQKPGIAAVSSEDEGAVSKSASASGSAASAEVSGSGAVAAKGSLWGGVVGGLVLGFVGLV